MVQPLLGILGAAFLINDILVIDWMRDEHKAMLCPMEIRPIAYASCTLTSTEQNYAQIEQQA